MSTRAYILLDLVPGKSAQALCTLRNKRGVVIADALEGSPNAIVLFEAAERLQLVEFIIAALASVDGITEDLHLLVTLHDVVPLSSQTSNIKKSRRRKSINDFE